MKIQPATFIMAEETEGPNETVVKRLVGSFFVGTGVGIQFNIEERIEERNPAGSLVLRAGFHHAASDFFSHLDQPAFISPRDMTVIRAIVDGRYATEQASATAYGLYWRIYATGEAKDTRFEARMPKSYAWLRGQALMPTMARANRLGDLINKAAFGLEPVVVDGAIAWVNRDQESRDEEDALMIQWRASGVRTFWDWLLERERKTP